MATVSLTTPQAAARISASDLKLKRKNERTCSSASCTQRRLVLREGNIITLPVFEVLVSCHLHDSRKLPLHVTSELMLRPELGIINT